jgi:hypothetical protein
MTTNTDSNTNTNTNSNTPATQVGTGAAATLATLPPSHLAMAVITAMFFWPLGIPAIINAAKVDRMIFMGDYAGAQHASAQAKKWSMWALGVAVGGFVLYLAVIGAMFASIATNIANNPALS